MVVGFVCVSKDLNLGNNLKIVMFRQIELDLSQ